MRIFQYTKTAKNMNILVPIVLMVGLMLWACYGLWNGENMMLSKLVLYTMPVLLASSFIGLHHPTRVTVTDEAIVFSAFGRNHSYRWDELTFIHLRNYRYVGKSFIRLGKPQILGGRYWLTNDLAGYNELIALLEQKSKEGEAQ
ncbi:hypothetical protein [Lysinibacillus piscis]|uniref:PH domain-containing protein n=1 Tax=Lysinibacillus piscis TaxID=2518931 RepID=A0ABQ5NFI6_9BACI|nr:hypothetical protein [Lysinibacillus sp. KH24]GLC87150.1 hypothetical protein LYSBPC_02770 [Lysinibacillus sp. KH24]